MDEDRFQQTPITRSRLVNDLRALNVRLGSVVMVHCAMSEIGWVVGGTQAVIEALLEVLGPEGTLVAYTSWEDNTWHLEEWPEEWREAYLAERPPFDSALSEARHDHGRLAERIRTWPGSCRSPHPEANVTAIGRKAEWITSEHPSNFPFGAGTPFAKIVETNGQVLLLGAPMGSITILHHAESLAEAQNKRLVKYRMPVATAGGTEWTWYDDIDTSSRGAFPYEEKIGEKDPFEEIGRRALEAGVAVSGKVGNSDSHLFDAKPLVQLGVAWIQEVFSG